MDPDSAVGARRGDEGSVGGDIAAVRGAGELCDHVDQAPIAGAPRQHETVHACGVEDVSRRGEDAVGGALLVAGEFCHQGTSGAGSAVEPEPGRVGVGELGGRSVVADLLQGETGDVGVLLQRRPVAQHER